MFWPCETRTSTCRNFATISSGLYRFLTIAVLLDVEDIPQVGPLQWGESVLIKPKSWDRHGLKPWPETAKKRLHHNVLAIALANKLARIAWGVLARGRESDASKLQAG